MIITPEIGLGLLLLTSTVVLFTTDRLPMDTSALLILVFLGLTDSVPGIELLPQQTLFSGFSSNAVMSVIGVTILGYAVDHAGLMRRLGAWLERTGHSENARQTLVSTAAGAVSAFVQNIAAVALFIPICSRIAKRNNFPLSRLLMPMGFAVILGGTLTLVGSGPLILVNDLLPAGVEKFNLFSVTPIGLSLLVSGVALFALFGHRLLPGKQEIPQRSNSLAQYKQLYQVEGEIHQIGIDAGSTVRGLTVGELEERFGIEILAMAGEEVILSPHRAITLHNASHLAVIAVETKLQALLAHPGIARAENETLTEALSPDIAGFAEVVVRPGTWLIGKSIRQIRIRKRFGLTPVAIFRGHQIFHNQLREIRLQAGDTLLCHIRWRHLARLEQGQAFAVINSDFPHEPENEGKAGRTLLICAVALGLILFSPLALPLILIGSALAMVISGVLSMNQAYGAVSWQTVFLLACLIPLGMAMEHTGTAAWIAERLLALLGDRVVEWQLQLCFALLATLFSLTISNIGATVLLVPLAVQIAMNAGFDPRPLALLVAVCVSNSFIIPTHQVNALIMTPGGYRVKDFIRAGGALTLLFIAVSVAAVNLFY